MQGLCQIFVGVLYYVGKQYSLWLIVLGSVSNLTRDIYVIVRHTSTHTVILQPTCSTPPHYILYTPTLNYITTLVSK